MDVDAAKSLLDEAIDDEEPVVLPRGVLSGLTAADIHADVRIQVGNVKDKVIHVEWDGLLCSDGVCVWGEAEYIWTRKYWYEPISLEYYLDLVRRAVEVRARDHGDVELSSYEDDGAFIQLRFRLATGETNLGTAYTAIRRLSEQLEEPARAAAAEAGSRLAEIAGRVSGWGTEPLDVLLDSVEKATGSDARGRALEELVARLLETIDGFSVTNRIRTATEEIDIEVLNASADPRFQREGALIVAECKNWTAKCGKDEMVLFKQKIENRSGRCSVGFLVSWNGFASTVPKEILRGSREHPLVVPVTGKDLRAAVRDSNALEMLANCWSKAVNL